MSVSVVLPTGVVSRYSCANWVKYVESSQILCKLYTRDPAQGGTFVAAVPAGSIVSFQHPDDVVHTGKAPAATLSAALEIVHASIERIENWSDRGKLADIKKRLTRFDARTRRFRSTT